MFKIFDRIYELKIKNKYIGNKTKQIIYEKIKIQNFNLFLFSFFILFIIY